MTEHVNCHGLTTKRQVRIINLSLFLFQFLMMSLFLCSPSQLNSTQLNSTRIHHPTLFLLVGGFHVASLLNRTCRISFIPSFFLSFVPTSLSAHRDTWVSWCVRCHSGMEIWVPQVYRQGYWSSSLIHEIRLRYVFFKCLFGSL